MGKITLIAAMDKQGLIGRNNDLPWSLPADLVHFKKKTVGKPIVMGRKTYESIGRPLPKRRNVVLSRRLVDGPGFEVYRSLASALLALQSTDGEIMIIGGAQVYRDALPRADRMYLTVVEHTFDGDTYYPSFCRGDWSEVDAVFRPADEKNPYACRFITLERGRHGKAIAHDFPATVP